MMLVVVLSLLLGIVALGPGFHLGDAAGVFVEGLPAELGTAVAMVDGFGVAALLHYGRQTVKLSYFVSVLKAIAVGAEGDQQARGQSGAGGRKASEDGGVVMLVHRLLNFFV